MMDPLEWMVTLGNINLAVWLNQTLGWVYVIVKLLIYLALGALVARKVYRLWRYNYLVHILITGPEKTITETTDKGAILQIEGKTVFKCVKLGVMPFVPERKHITPLTGNKFFWQPNGAINLYKYGSSNYSIVPMDTLLGNEKIKLMPNESDIAAAIETAEQIHEKYARKPLWKDLAPLLVSLVPSLIIALLLIMSASSFQNSASQLAASSAQLAKSSDRLAMCNVEQAPLPGREIPDVPVPGPEQPPSDNTPMDKYIPW